MRYTCIVIMCLVSGSAHAQAAKDLISPDSAPITAHSRKILDALAADRPGQANRADGIVARDGTVYYTFGAQRPAVVCSPLQICDVALEAGESIIKSSLGDTNQWGIEVVKSVGDSPTGPEFVPHVLIKTYDAGLETSLVITTDRRTYKLLLQSTPTEYMHSVAFRYPDTMQNKALGGDPDALLARRRGERTRSTGQQHRAGRQGPSKTRQAQSAAAGMTGATMAHRYKLSGDDPVWKPELILNDGALTYIHFPPSLRNTNAPSLYIIRGMGDSVPNEEGGMGKWHVQRNGESTVYVVDQVFDEAILVTGVGGEQQKITIERE